MRFDSPSLTECILYGDRVDKNECEKLTVSRLKKLCKWRDISGSSKMRKAQLVDTCCASSSEQGKVCFFVDGSSSNGGLIQ